MLTFARLRDFLICVEFISLCLIGLKLIRMILLFTFSRLHNSLICVNLIDPGYLDLKII